MSPALSPVTVPFQTSPPARCRWLIFSPHVWARRPGLLKDQQLTDTHPTAPSAQTPPLTPQTLTCQQKPRSQGCCNFRNRTVNPFFFFFLNRQNEEKKRREAKTRIAQASPQAAAAGLLTSTQLTSGRPGFCKQLVLFFFPQTKSVLAAKSSCPGGCLWSGGAGRGCFKHGENALAGFGKGQALHLPGLQLARPHRRECEFRASKTFRVMLQK